MAPNDLKWAKNDPKWPKKKDSEFLSNSAIKTKNSEILSKLRNSELCGASDLQDPQHQLTCETWVHVVVITSSQFSVTTVSS